jgi:hypothetical protein
MSALGDGPLSRLQIRCLHVIATDGGVAEIPANACLIRQHVITVHATRCAARRQCRIDLLAALYAVLAVRSYY